MAGLNFGEQVNQEKVLRYRAAVLKEGKEDGQYSMEKRGTVFNIVAGKIGDIDMSKDKTQISGVVGQSMSDPS